MLVATFNIRNFLSAPDKIRHEGYSVFVNGQTASVILLPRSKDEKYPLPYFLPKHALLYFACAEFITRDRIACIWCGKRGEKLKITQEVRSPILFSGTFKVPISQAPIQVVCQMFTGNGQIFPLFIIQSPKIIIDENIARIDLPPPLWGGALKLLSPDMSRFKPALEAAAAKLSCRYCLLSETVHWHYATN